MGDTLVPLKRLRRNRNRTAGNDRFADRGNRARYGETVPTGDDWLAIVSQAVDEVANPFEIEPPRQAVLLVSAVRGGGLKLLTREGDPLIVLVDLHTAGRAKEGHRGVDDRWPRVRDHPARLEGDEGVVEMNDRLDRIVGVDPEG